MKNEYDFSKAKRTTDIPHLNKLRESQSNKTRISIMLDNDVLEGFKQRAQEHGVSYQTEINATLKEILKQGSLEEVLRRVLREELNQT